MTIKEMIREIIIEIEIQEGTQEIMMEKREIMVEIEIIIKLFKLSNMNFIKL
jgi:hypothetical protein